MINKTKIDRFGRVVIPKKIRQDLGIDTDTRIIIEKEGDSVIIRPDSDDPFIKEIDGIIVVCSEPTEGFNDFINQERENRIKRIVKDVNP